MAQPFQTLPYRPRNDGGPVIRPAVMNHTPITYQGHTFAPVERGGPAFMNVGVTGNTASVSQGPPSRSQINLNQRVGSALNGGLRGQYQPDAGVWGVGGRTYPTTDAGAGSYQNRIDEGPAVAPRYGQTVRGAQEHYLNTMAAATNSTQRRVGEMFSDPALGRRYTPANYVPGGPQYGLLGTMNASSGNVNQIIRRPDGSTLVRGPTSTADWNASASTLPGADGRTNAEMLAVRRANVAAQNKQQDAARIVARAQRNGLSPRTTPAVRAAYMQLGIPIPGEPRGATQQASVAPTGIAGHQQRIAAAARNPGVQAMGLSPDPSALANNLRRIENLPPATSPAERMAAADLLESQLALVGGGTQYQQSLVRALRENTVGTARQQQADQNRRDMFRATGIAPGAPTLGPGVWNLPPGGI